MSSFRFFTRDELQLIGRYEEDQPSFPFGVAYGIVVLLVMVFAILDAVWLAITPSAAPQNGSISLPNSSLSLDSADQLAVSRLPLYGCPFISWPILIISVICLVFIILEMITYQPILFAWARPSTPVHILFEGLAARSRTLRQYLHEVQNTEVTTQQSLNDMEENLTLELFNYFIIDRLRLLITLRMILSLIGAVLALSLCGYLLTVVMEGNFLQGIAPDAGVFRHIYFTIVLFFTIGFGDVTPHASAVGYSYVFVSALLLVMLTYFVFSSILASVVEFQANVRNAVRSYIISHSAL